MRTIYIEVVTELPDGQWGDEVEADRIEELENYIRSMDGIVSVEVKGVS